MGFSPKNISINAAEAARETALAARRLEEKDAQSGANDDQTIAPPPAARPASPAPAAQGGVFAPRNDAASSRPSFGGPKAPEAAAPSPAAAPASGNIFASGATARPSFGAHSATPAAPAQTGRPGGFRPSLGVASQPPLPPELEDQPAAPAAPSRPSFGPPAQAPAHNPASIAAPASERSSAPLPQARGVFVRSQQGQANAQAPAPWDGLSDQALFEIVCTHRNMAPEAIESARSRAALDPDRTRAQMRRIYQEEIAPKHARHAQDLPHARELNPDKVVFIVRKDNLQKCVILDPAEARATGQVLFDGATIESVRASSSPFPPPSQLFAVEPDVRVENEQAEPVEEAAPSQGRSSLKP